jgi:very-long-chain (3R)-3-hydroxyacyl-CoA dehydratase
MAQSLSKQYLILYNLAEVGGWIYLLYSVIQTLRNDSPNVSTNVWPKHGTTIRCLQNTSLLETVHSLLGLVSGGWSSPLKQSLGRMWITYGVADYVPHNRLMIPLAISWSLADIIRYLFYVTELLGVTPYVLKWLRYNAFLLLYPVGMATEIALVVDAWRNGKGFPQTHSSLYSILVLIFFAGIVGIGYPQMFKYMLKQRYNKLYKK